MVGVGIEKDKPDARGTSTGGLWDRRAIKAGYGDWKDYWEKLENQASMSEFYQKLTGWGIRVTASGGAQGRCPFHDDRNPSLSILPGDKRYYCHAASCRARGSVFDFIMHMSGWNLAQTTWWLAGELNIPQVRLPGTGNGDSPAARTEPGNAGKPVKSVPVVRSGARENPVLGDVLAAPEEKLPESANEMVAWHPIYGKWQSCRADHWYVYRTGECKPVLLVGRRDARPGISKSFFRLTWRNLTGKGHGWVLTGWPQNQPTPIFGAERLHVHAGEVRNLNRSTLKLVMVEGEKTCLAGHDLLHPDWCVLSPLGGSREVSKADWGSIAGSWQDVVSNAREPMRIVVWPDADLTIGEHDPASVFTGRIIEGLALAFGEDTASRNFCSLSVVWPGERWPKGFDLADLQPTRASCSWVIDRLANSEPQGWPSGSGS